MDENTRKKILEKLVSGNELKKESKSRKKEFICEIIKCSDDEERARIKNEYETKGFEFKKDFKSSIHMKKLKNHGERFENKIWNLFASLGFTFLNKGKDFKLPYDKNNPNNNQQIDVFAKDDECVIWIECKSSKEEKPQGDFKKDLEAWKEKKGGIENSIKKLFPKEKLKTKFLFATENQGMSEVDLETLKNLRGKYFSEETLNYFIDLQKQLGNVAKYQFLGYLLEGNTIPELENEIPAIRGKMGGRTYYSFSIKPDTLLKISYVLHNNKANKDMLPTYQRLIKKARLKAVSNFINDEKGYFPNSIVININNEKKELPFERANTQVKNAISSVGVLRLPKKYKSAYIIDGQHRLYGYANSEYKTKNTIPVVAFINLGKSEQVDLFMQINENQKAISKTLRATLNADLKWDSKNKEEQMQALCSRIAISLSEDSDSPLYGHISVGEDSRIVTPTSIITGLKKGKFLGKVKKDSIEKPGLFYKGDLNDAYKNILLFLKLSFEYLTKDLKDDFNKQKDSFLFVNKGVTATLMILSDILDLVLKDTGENINQDNVKEIFEKCTKYLDPIVSFVKNMDDTTNEKLRLLKGAGAPTKYWRKFQIEIKNSFSEFSPEGLDKYIENEKKALNISTYKLITEIEEFMRKDFKNKLIEKYGEEWAWKRGVPEKIQEAAEAEMRKRNRKRPKNEETEEWDNLYLINYREIASKNWTFKNKDKTRSSFFDKYYTLPRDKKLNKEDKTKWFVELNDSRKIVSHPSSDQISEEQYKRIKYIHSNIIK